jgi:hypothetical protein
MFVIVCRCSRIRLVKQIRRILRFSLFADIRPGNCQTSVNHLFDFPCVTPSASVFLPQLKAAAL